MLVLRYIFLLLLTNSAIYVCCGQDIIDGYIVTRNGDTVQGKIKLPGDKIFGRNVYARLGGGINFKAADTDVFKDYAPGHLLGFGYYTKNTTDPVRRYSHEKVYGTDRFLIIMIDGPLRLYKNVTMQKIGYNTVNVDYLYIKKNESRLFAIEDNYYYKVKKRAPLKKYLADCTAVEPILNEKELDLDKLVKQYNQSCNEL
jgi:hypothetical protein